MVPNKKNLLLHFPKTLNDNKATNLSKLLKEAAGNHEAVDDVLDRANKILDMHGVEPIRGEYHVDGFYLDIVALYLNSGDTYNSTILYETETENFVVTTLGDWVEANQAKYNII